MIFSKNQKSIIIDEKVSEYKKQIFYNYKFYIYIIIFTYFLCSIHFFDKEQNYEKEENTKLINENFFFIDSNNLDNIVPHMYGYYISVDGIYTDNFYKQIQKNQYYR